MRHYIRINHLHKNRVLQSLFAIPCLHPDGSVLLRPLQYLAEHLRRLQSQQRHWFSRVLNQPISPYKYVEDPVLSVCVQIGERIWHRHLVLHFRQKIPL